jgi:MSHA biogenesis protein MshJ
MSALSTQWKQLGARFDAYSQRERALLAAALILGTLLLGNSLLVDPNFARAKIAQRLGEQQAMEATSLESQITVTKAQLQVDPDAGRKAEIVRLKAALATVENNLKALEGSLVPPEQMNSLLEQLLASNTRLRLVSLKSLAPINLAAAGKTDEAAKLSLPAAQAKEKELGLYKHGVEIRLEGSYADLYAWMSQLESTQRKLLWGDVRFTVVEHPRSVLSLTVYTLSTDKAWLAI